jgi:hypothetical protein
MIWLVAYLAIGMGFALYMPIKQARSLAKLDAMTASEIAAMSDDDRKMLNSAATVIRTNYKTAHLVVGGLLWPAQLFMVVVVEILFAVRRSGHDH